MEVYLSEHIAPSAYARLARHFEIVDNFDHPERLAAMVIRRAVVPRAVIAHAPNLKVIAMHGVSRDTIDTAAAAEFGVPVPNVPGLGAPAVAELAVADLLALNRQLKFVNNGLCAGRFDHFGAEEFVCHEMTGRTLGLVGTGNIAHRVADILRAAFDVRVLCWNPRRTAASTVLMLRLCPSGVTPSVRAVSALPSGAKRRNWIVLPPFAGMGCFCAN